LSVYLSLGTVKTTGRATPTPAPTGTYADLTPHSIPISRINTIHEVAVASSLWYELTVAPLPLPCRLHERLEVRVRVGLGWRSYLQELKVEDRS
jgi:hypothetical protein